MRIALSLVLLAGLGAGARTFAQEGCAAGPQCTATGQRANPLVERFKAMSGSGSASESAKAAYCVDKLVAEISRVCADEQKAMQNAECASLAYQQRDQLLEVAATAEASLKAYYTGPLNWKTICGWKK